MITKIGSLLCFFFLGATSVSAGETIRVSVDSSGIEGDNFSALAAVSADGRYVAFHSYASNLVPGDTNGVADVFVHDRATSQIARISVDSSGNQATGESIGPAISSDGQIVSFHSYAANLVPGDSNGFSDVFIHDRTTGQTVRVSVDSSGNQGNAGCSAPSMSSDGGTIAFVGLATNLVSGDTNGVGDVFVHDRASGQTTRVSVDSSGNQANSASSLPAISSDGLTVAFLGLATNLVPGDTNGFGDVFVHERATGQTRRVSVDSSGSQGNGVSSQPSISSDGRYVAFRSAASNLVLGDTNGQPDVFVHDRTTAQTARVSVTSGGIQGNHFSEFPSISADGRFVAFHSEAFNLVSGDTNGTYDVFVHDRATGQTTRASVSSSGNEGNGGSLVPSLSLDGRSVAFGSNTTNLVAADTNGVDDVFVHDRLVGVVYCFGDGSGTPCPCSNSGAPDEGCANSTGIGGSVIATGSSSVGTDDLGFAATHLLPGQPALLFVGDNALNNGDGAHFGDGLRCAGGNVVRLDVKVPNASGGAAWGPALHSLGGWMAGDTRRFQVWYRDPSGSPCGSGFNLTNAVEVSFDP